MTTLMSMWVAWGVITILFIILLLYRRTITKGETDWIPLTDDAKEESAIQAQTIMEMRTKKLTIPIRTLGTLSVVILLVILGFWLYQTFTSPMAPPQ